jgi:hypothetical protein
LIKEEEGIIKDNKRLLNKLEGEASWDSEIPGFQQDLNRIYKQFHSSGKNPRIWTGELLLRMRGSGRGL